MTGQVNVMPVLDRLLQNFGKLITEREKRGFILL